MSDFDAEPSRHQHELKQRSGEIPAMKGGGRLTERLFPGSEILAAPELVPAVWGTGRAVVWAQEQPFWIVAPTGIGKTTLSGMLLKAGLRIDGLDQVLGFPVKAFEKPTLYIAADRPSQIMRALKRGLRKEHEQTLNDQLFVWKGSLPYELSDPRCSEYLTQDVLELGVGQVIIDSMKDVASNMPENEPGSAISRALNNLAVAGIDVLVNSHLIKGEAKPTGLGKVYGSSMMMNSAGTVVLMWGNPGEGTAEISTLKYADEEGIGPVNVLIDQRLGVLEIAPESRLDHWMTMHQSFTVLDVARYLYHGDSSTATVTNGEKNKARRKLTRHLGKEHTASPRIVLSKGNPGKADRYEVVNDITELTLLAQEHEEGGAL